MPNSRDAAKRHRQSLKRRERNRSARSRVRTGIKAFEAVLESKDKSLAQEKFLESVKLIDTAVGKGLYHSNTAARKKSRMHKKLTALI